MDVPLLALGTIEQIRDISVAIGTNVASQILINMAKKESPAIPASFEPEIRREMADCVICCLQEEPNAENRQLLVRCLFDDATIHELVGMFLARQYDVSRIIGTAKSRLPAGVEWDIAEQPVTQGVARFVERFKQAVSSNQILFNRLSMVGWERDERQAADIREIKHLLIQNVLTSVQRSVADFPADGGSGAVGMATFSSSSPVLSSADDFPEGSSAAVAFLKDDFESALHELKLGSAKKARNGFETVVTRLEKLGVETDRKLGRSKIWPTNAQKRH